VYFTGCVFPTVVIMSNHYGGTTSCGAGVVWVAWGYVVGGTLVSGTTQQCRINTKRILYNTDTVAYSSSYSTEHKKEVHYTLVHNNYSSTQHSQWCTTHT